MKKIYLFLVAILVTSFSFGQDLLISGVFDGPLSGGTPKVVELYVVNDIADLSAYAMGSANNGGGTDGEEFTFPADAFTAGDFIYLAFEGSGGSANPGSFNTYFGFQPDYIDGFLGINGDDAIELFNAGVVIDTFGDINADGTGSVWEYLDGWAYRVDATGPDGASFITGNWTFSGINVNDGQTDNASAPTPFPIGTYTNTGTPNPTISITSPSNGFSFAPGTTSVDIVFTTANTVGGETVDINVNGTITNNISSPFTVTTADGQTYNVTVDLMSGGSPVSTSTVDFSVATLTVVNDLAALRAEFAGQTVGDVFQVTNEVFINYGTSFRNQKFIEDASAGILIDDQPGNITSGIRGDGLTGITGTLSEFNGMMQFSPVVDATLVSPASFSNTPQIVTLATLTTNSEDYESELVKVVNVMLDNSINPTFVNNTNYNMTQGADMFTFRTFFGVDYTDGNVPTVAQDIVGLIRERSEGHSLGARDLADFTDHTASVNTNEIEGFSIYPNPIVDGKLVINTLSTSTKNVEVFSLLGKRIYTDSFTGSNTELNLSNLNTGIYILKVTEGTQIATSKLVVR